MTWADEYPCIEADAPWPEQGGGKIKRGADKHYDLIKKKEDILRVMVQAPCWRPAKNGHLWLWVTNNYLPWGMWLMEALGYTYKTNRAWGKCDEHELKNEAGEPTGVYAWTLQRPGIGQYMFGQHELLLFGTRGKAITPLHKIDKTLQKPRTLLLAPRTEVHSEKPAQAYRDIEAVSPGPRLSMFARDPRPGWDVWGNEVEDHGRCRVMLDGIHTREVGSEFHPVDCDCGGCEVLDGVCEGCGYVLEDDGSCLRCAGRKKTHQLAEIARNRGEAS